jgi:hypothetical protein
MDFLHQHWAVIADNPWLFVSWTLVVASAIWAVIHFIYRHRLDTYKHRVEEDAIEVKRLQDKLSEMKEEHANQSSASPASASVAGTYNYSDAGDHGLNILGQTLTDLVVDQTYSMAAKVPENGVLKIHLAGTPPVNLQQMPGAWVYSTSTRNWQGARYDEQDHTQVFTARSGEADLAFIPRRSGKITVTIYEGGRSPAWNKVLKVVEPS